MRIGLSYDLKEATAVEQDGGGDALEEYDSLETVELIAASLQSEGRTVVMLGGGRDFLDNILREKVDLVFNIAEGRGCYRSREAQIPSILEMLGIPYSGSDPLCLAICLDKAVTKRLVSTAGVCTPKWHVTSDSRELYHVASSGFPMPAIIKPAYEGSSKGIRLSSVIENPEQAVEAADRLLQNYRQPVMMEEFIEGDEVTVGIVGNSPPRIIGMMAIRPKRRSGHFVYSLEVKRDYLELVDYECPPKFERRALQNLEESALSVFEVLGCRDFARLDFRMGPGGVPYFLEINPLPGLGNHSDLVIMAKSMGWTHQKLVGAVLNVAIERYPQCARV